jgi:hypothetical protein
MSMLRTANNLLINRLFLYWAFHFLRNLVIFIAVLPAKSLSVRLVILFGVGISNEGVLIKIYFVSSLFSGTGKDTSQAEN